MRLDLKENIVFPFSAPQWPGKILKATLCYILIVTLPAVMGYQLAVIRDAANGEDEKLPEFGPDFGAMWVTGFIFSFFLGVLALVPALGIGGLAFGGAMTVQGNDNLTMLFAFGGLGLFFLFCFALALLMPALMLRYAMTDSTSSLFDIGAALNDIKQGPGDYALIFFFPMLASLVTSVVSATGIGAILFIPLTILTMVIQARMLGNYYRAYFH